MEQNKKTIYLAVAFLSCLTLTVLVSSQEVLALSPLLMGAITLYSTAKV